MASGSLVLVERLPWSGETAGILVQKDNSLLLCVWNQSDNENTRQCDRES